MTPSVLSLPVAEDKTTPHISSDPLDIVGLLSQAHHPSAGAVVLFSGDVRNHSIGKDVDYLEYEAHESLASDMIKSIITEAIKKWDLNIAFAEHRIGKVAVSESAVVVITASPHRHEAFAANRYIIDRIKHEVPIWKCEYFSDGTKKWGGNCNCHEITGDPSRHVYEQDTAERR